MRTLLSSDPFLPPDVREAVAQDRDAHEQLVRLGASYCEAAELLDGRDCSGGRPAAALKHAQDAALPRP